MSNKIVIGSANSKTGVNTDINSKITFSNNLKEINDGNLSEVLNISERFDYERQNSLRFKIYGTINYISNFNNLYKLYNSKEDFFKRNNPNSILLKKLTNSFEFYIVKPSLNLYNMIGTDYYYSQYDILTNINQIDIIKANESTNIFGDEMHNFFVKNNIDLTNIIDYTGKPVSKLFLYVKYIPESISPSQDEKLFSSEYDTDLTYQLIQIPTTPPLSIGDLVNGDIYKYSSTDYIETKVKDMKYVIEFNYLEGVNDKQLRFIYSPFIEIKLRDYSSNENTINTGNTYTYEYPSYARKIDNNGNIKWNDILDFGYIEPVSDRGLSYPFLNNSHYVFNNVNLIIQPDLTHENTSIVFNEIKATYENINYNLNSNIDNSSDVC